MMIPPQDGFLFFVHIQINIINFHFKKQHKFRNVRSLPYILTKKMIIKLFCNFHKHQHSQEEIFYER